MMSLVLSQSSVFLKVILPVCSTLVFLIESVSCTIRSRFLTPDSIGLAIRIKTRKPMPNFMENMRILQLKTYKRKFDKGVLILRSSFFGKD
jgi:hypothetical protein